MDLTLRRLSCLIVERKRYTEFFFIVIYIVGIFGTAMPFSHTLFIRLFPSVLILSSFFIILFHTKPADSRALIVFTIIGLCGFLIEVAGVNAGFIFGRYRYGETLGLKVFNTPLLIGINWAMLTYASSAISEELKVPVSMKILAGSMIMLAYDIIMEQVAPILDMWHFEDGKVPLSNYLGWFVAGVVFQILARVSKCTTKNSFAWKIMLIQALFFIALIIIFKY